MKKYQWNLNSTNFNYKKLHLLKINKNPLYNIIHHNNYNFNNSMNILNNT